MKKINVIIYLKKQLSAFRLKELAVETFKDKPAKSPVFSYCSAFPGFGLHFEEFSCFLDK